MTAVKQILLVDDDPDFVGYANRISQMLECRLESVGDVNAAKEQMLTNPWQAVIVGGRLPDGNGIELIGWIRETFDAEMPIAFISDAYDDSDSFRLLKNDLGVGFVLNKPVSPGEMEAVFRSFLSVPEQDAALSVPDFMRDIMAVYDRRIPDKIELLDGLIRAVGVKASRDNLLKLEVVLHKIAGTATSYGYARATDLCREHEVAIHEMISSEGAADATVHGWLLRFLHDLKMAFQTRSMEI